MVEGSRERDEAGKRRRKERVSSSGCEDDAVRRLSRGVLAAPVPMLAPFASRAAPSRLKTLEHDAREKKRCSKMARAKLTAVLLGALADGNGSVDLAVGLVAVLVVATGTVVARLRVVGLGGGSSSGRSSRRRSSGGLGLGGDGGKVVAVALDDRQTQVSIRVCMLAPLPRGATSGRGDGELRGERRRQPSSLSPRRALLVGGRGEARAGEGGYVRERRTRCG